MNNSKITIIMFLACTGCNGLYFSPVSWFDSYDKRPETSATQYGDCTTDAQCEELVPGHNFLCYKEQSYVGHCVQIVQ